VDLQALIETAEFLQIDPVDLLTVISYETAGTLDPMMRGPTTQWGQHRGLIQFGEPQARQYGVDFSSPQAALASQLGRNGAIVRYLLGNGFEPGMGILDLYSTINAGAPGLYHRSDAGNGGAPGTVLDKVNDQMGGHRERALRMLQDHVPSQSGRYAGDVGGGAGLGASTLSGGIDWVQVDTPNGPRWFSRDYFRGEDGTYVRGSLNAAAPILERYGARLPASREELEAFYAQGQQLPLINSGQFAGPGIVPTADNVDELIALHNAALEGQEIPDGPVFGHLKDLLADGSLYDPHHGLQRAHRSQPDRTDYSQGIRLVRDNAPETVGAVGGGAGLHTGVSGGVGAGLGQAMDMPEPSGLGDFRPLPTGRGLDRRTRRGAARPLPPSAEPQGEGLNERSRGDGLDLLALGRLWFSGALG
jgi:hypothetical protein